MKPLMMTTLVLFCTTLAHAQSVRSLVNGGNTLYQENKYTEAEERYRAALEKEQGLVQGHFNLGNSLYKQGKFDESVREFANAATRADAGETQAFAHYNRGNAHLKAGQFQEAVNAYVDALKLNPRDADAKYNLSYALEKLRQQQQQQQQQQDKNNQQQDRNKDDKDNQKQDQDKNEKQDQQPQNGQRQDQQQQAEQQEQSQQQKQMASQEQRMSREDAQRILDVLKNSEKDVQKQLRKRQATRAKTEKDW